MRVVLFIRSLEIGGAERQLVVLAQGLKARGVDVRVLTFYPGGALRGELEAARVPVADLAKRGRWDVLPFFFRLVGWLQRERPAVLYSFLPTANTLGVIAGRLSGVSRIVWGVRSSNLDLSRYDWLSRVDAFVARHLARFADRIVCNSREGARSHGAAGYPRDKLAVIENGIDTARFSYDPEGRARVRREWGIADGEVLIGLVARLDPMKGHETFLHAAALLAREVPKVRIVCVGDGPAEYARLLKELAASLGLTGLVSAGARTDMAAVYSAFDIASSSSYGEGFSNAIAEAMACERVCVVTDVGDSARIVAETGWAVPPRDPDALAKAWTAALLLSPGERLNRGRAARARIKAEFSVTGMVEKMVRELGL